MREGATHKNLRDLWQSTKTPALQEAPRQGPEVPVDIAEARSQSESSPPTQGGHWTRLNHILEELPPSRPPPSGCSAPGRELGDHEAKVHQQKEGEHERGKGMFEDPRTGRFALNETAHGLLNSPVRLGLGLDGIGGRMAYAWGSLLSAVQTAPGLSRGLPPSFLGGSAGPSGSSCKLRRVDGAGWARHSRPGGAGRRRLGIGAHSGRRRRGDGIAAGGNPSRPAQVRGTLVDLPPTVARSVEIFQVAGVAERVTAVGQSFFDPLPAGADLYLLKNVLGDWLDREAMAILRHCAEAAHPQVASSSSAECRPTRTAVRRRPC